MSYVELVTASNFSFLRGASHPGELVYRQAEAWGAGGAGANGETAQQTHERLSFEGAGRRYPDGDVSVALVRQGEGVGGQG